MPDQPDSSPATAAGRPPLPPPNPLLGFVACECGGSHDFRDHPDDCPADVPGAGHDPTPNGRECRNCWAVLDA